MEDEASAGGRPAGDTRRFPQATRGLAFSGRLDPDAPVAPTPEPRATGNGLAAAMTGLLPASAGAGERDTRGERSRGHRLRREFFARNVSDTASYTYAFTGMFTGLDGDRIVHDFQVSVTADEALVRRPVARVIERRIELAGDSARLAEKNWERMTVEVDARAHSPRQLRRAISAYLDRWHQRYARMATWG